MTPPRQRQPFHGLPGTWVPPIVIPSERLLLAPSYYRRKLTEHNSDDPMVRNPNPLTKGRPFDGRWKRYRSLEDRACKAGKYTSKMRRNSAGMLCHGTYCTHLSRSQREYAPTEQGKGNTTTTMEMRFTLGSEVSMDKTVQSLRGTALDAMSTGHDVFAAGVIRHPRTSIEDVGVISKTAMPTTTTRTVPSAKLIGLDPPIVLRRTMTQGRCKS